MKSLPFPLLVFAEAVLFCGCSLSLNIKAIGRTDQEVAGYQAKRFPSISRLYRLNNDTLLDRLVPYGIDRINFVNIYTKDGRLNQSTADNSCEFATLAARDGVLRVSKPQENLAEILKVMHPVAGSPISGSKPVILFGYARYIRRVPLMKSRMRLLRDRLAAVDTGTYEVVSLCLDPEK